MLCKAISLALISVVLYGSVAAQEQPQSPSQTVAKMQQVLRKAQEKDKAVNVSLERKIDNQNKLSGKVSEISDTSFTLTEHKTGKITKLAYKDVQKIKQRGWSKGLKITLVVIVGVIVAAIVVSKPWQSE